MLRLESPNATILSPVKQFSEWNVSVPRPPDDHLGGEPGAPAEVVHHQHQHQHLRSLLVLGQIISHLTKP